MLRKWKEKMAFKATLRELIMVSRRHQWNEFIEDICISLDYIEIGIKLGMAS